MTFSLNQIRIALQKHPSYPDRILAGIEIPDADWELLLAKSRQGDKTAFQILCCQGKPLADKISSKRYFAATLGEEACSIATQTMAEFFSCEPRDKEEKDIPRQLCQAIKCDLLNQIRKQETRNRHEQYQNADDRNGENKEEGTDIAASLPADSRKEPENQLLENEYRQNIRECLKDLGAKERQVIEGFFFRQLSMAEIAREMHCTANNTYVLKNAALRKLRKIFDEKQITPSAETERSIHEQTTTHQTL